MNKEAVRLRKQDPIVFSSLHYFRQLLDMTRPLIRDGTLIQLCIYTLQVLPVM